MEIFEWLYNRYVQAALGVIFVAAMIGLMAWIRSGDGPSEKWRRRIFWLLLAGALFDAALALVPFRWVPAGARAFYDSFLGPYIYLTCLRNVYRHWFTWLGPVPWVILAGILRALPFLVLALLLRRFPSRRRAWAAAAAVVSMFAYWEHYLDLTISRIDDDLWSWSIDHLPAISFWVFWLSIIAVIFWVAWRPKDRPANWTVGAGLGMLALAHLNLIPLPRLPHYFRPLRVLSEPFISRGVDEIDPGSLLPWLKLFLWVMAGLFIRISAPSLFKKGARGIYIFLLSANVAAIIILTHLFQFTAPVGHFVSSYFLPAPWDEMPANAVFEPHAASVRGVAGFAAVLACWWMGLKLVEWPAGRAWRRRATMAAAACWIILAGFNWATYHRFSKHIVDPEKEAEIRSILGHKGPSRNQGGLQRFTRAVETGNVQEVSRIFGQMDRWDVESLVRGGESESGVPWIITAVSSDQIEMAKLFIDHGADVNQPIPVFGDYPLHLAVRRGSMPLVSLLLERGARVGVYNLDYQSPSGLALETGQFEIFDLLLSRLEPTVFDEANLGMVERLRARLKRDPSAANGWATEGLPPGSPLHYAVAGGSLASVRLLIDAGADPNGRQGAGADFPTPLQMTVTRDQAEIARLLLERGAEDAPNSIGKTLVHLAAEEGAVRILRVLAQMGQNLERDAVLNRPEWKNKKNFGEPWTPLFLASAKGQDEAVRFLMEWGARPNVYDLRRLLDRGRIEVARLMIGKIPGADLFVCPGELVMTSIGKSGDIGLAEYVLGLSEACLSERGPEGNCRSYHKRVNQIMLSAGEAGRDELILVLLRKGLDVDSSDGFGTTALVKAAGAQKISTCRLLLLHGADPNEGRDTPLQLAAAAGNMELVKLLLAHGANPCRRSLDSSTTPRSAARYHQQGEILRLLETVPCAPAPKGPDPYVMPPQIIHMPQ